MNVSKYSAKHSVRVMGVNLAFTLLAALAVTPFAAAQDSSSSAVRIPPAVAAELKADREKIDAEKSKTVEMRTEVLAAKESLDAQKAELSPLQEEVKALKVELDMLNKRVPTSSPADLNKFNRKADEYNKRAKLLAEKSAGLTESMTRYNELAAKYQAQTVVLNQLSEAYNAKLRESGQ